MLRRFLKKKETKDGATNTLGSALDTIKIELKQKDDYIVSLEKEIVVWPTLKKRLEFKLAQKTN